MDKDYVYTEISGRNSGKTTRLISKVVKDYIKDKGNCSRYIIVADSTSEKDNIRRSIYNFLETLSPTDKDLIIQSIKGVVFGNDLSFLRGNADYRIYFDEYDNYKWNNQGVLNLRFNMKWAKSVYSVTSPLYYRDRGGLNPGKDPILNFIKLSNGEYYNYYNSSVDEEYPLLYKQGLFILPEDLD